MRMFLLALALVGPAQAADINRCTIDGRTIYQTTPCPASARAAVTGIKAAAESSGSNAPWVPAPQGVDLEPGKALCLRVAPSQFKDPDSVRILHAFSDEKQMRVFEDDKGRRVRAWAYMMSINAKNSYGGYAGAKDYWCFVSEDQQRLVQLKRIGGG
jgi:hypothetical protein